MSLAGYEKDMRDMLEANAGLSSRFSEELLFKDFDEKTIVEMLCNLMAKDKLPFDNNDRYDITERYRCVVGSGELQAR